jgi:hypothetical protein
MLAILVKTLPFFAVIALGWGAARARVVGAEATAELTRFVFYFALSAMLFGFAANLSIAGIWDGRFAAAYLAASLAVYALAFAVALARRVTVEEAAVEAQCAVIGNTGFLGVPMLVLLMGPQAAGPVLMVLAVDLIVFSSLITLIMAARRGGGVGPAALGGLAASLLRNPMVAAMAAGLAWSATGLGLAAPVQEFLTLLGAAATPCALFAIGASLAARSAERLPVAAWLSLCKLVLHPAAAALAAHAVFAVAPQKAAVMVAAAALPVAGNVFILAQHYGVAPQRVSAAILVSTAASVLTLTAAVAWVEGDPP